MRNTVIALALLACCSTGFAYGTAQESALVITQELFEPFNDSTVVHRNNLLKWITAGCCLDAPIVLPEGALLIGIEVEACDDDPAAEVSFSAGKCDFLESGCLGYGIFATTGVAEAPGCVRVRTNLPAPDQIDNIKNTYFVQVSPMSALATFRAVRVFYKLQVSPGPAVATFGDVPVGSPFFKFVEALAKSGITAGCGGGNFCPGDPVTRGQMAVFLSAALGLHFAP